MIYDLEQWDIWARADRSALAATDQHFTDETPGATFPEACAAYFRDDPAYDAATNTHAGRRLYADAPARSRSRAIRMAPPRRGVGSGQ